MLGEEKLQGIFITVEGPDGAGKTSVISKLVPLLEEKAKVPIVVTREPGGNRIAEKIREVILDPANTEMDDRTEALLYAASRRQHLVEKILPALEKGKIVLCDRFVDSSLAYQGAGRKIGIEEVAKLNHFATAGLEPDLTLYLDVDYETGLERIKAGRKTEDQDRLDLEKKDFHQRVYKAYQDLAEKNPTRIQRIAADVSLDQVVQSCYDKIIQKYARYFQNGEEIQS